MAAVYSDTVLSELRSRLALEEIASDYVRLTKKGQRYWGICPFHNEKTASFTVDAESQLYYCFGCHEGGDLFHFVQRIENLEFYDAVKFLAERAHMDLPERPLTGYTKTSAQDRERIYEANAQAARYFNALLYKNEGAKALTYLYSRGLNDRDIRKFGLGYSPNTRGELQAEMEKNGFDKAILKRAGLIVTGEQGTRDMFRNRVMFPIISAQGRVLGFGGRALGDANPKYLNTAETPVFNKGKGVYGLNLARKERGLNRLVLVEGYMDVVSLTRLGINGVVAALGTALTDEQVRLMKRYAPEIWISYDGDQAGRAAALRALNIIEPHDIPVKVLDYPEGMDPDDYAGKYGAEGFNALPKLDATDYRLLRAKDDLDISVQDGMTQYALRACAILKRIKSPIELENKLRALVNETGYEREILLRQIGVTPETPDAAPKRRKPAEPKRNDSELAESELLSMAVNNLIPIELLDAKDFDIDENRRLAEWLISGKTVNAFIVGIEDEQERKHIMRAINYYPLPHEREDAIKEAESCMSTIRIARKDRRMREITEEIRVADQDRKRLLYEQLIALQDE